MTPLNFALGVAGATLGVIAFIILAMAVIEFVIMILDWIGKL